MDNVFPNRAKFLVVGLVRNCERNLKSDIYTFEQALKTAESVAFLLIESDSDDESLSVLHDFNQDKKNVSFISLGVLRDKYPVRTERIAFCRNRYLQEIKDNPIYNDIDYVIIADFDGINNKLTETSIKSCFKGKDWDVCCANQDGAYYDVWALRHNAWSPNDCNAQQRFLEAHGSGRFRSFLAAVLSRMLTISKTSEWIQVESAFGGCAIYRREVLLNAAYSGLTPEGDEVCEHVDFHRQIREAGGRIFINPEFINAGQVWHSRKAYGLGLVKFWLRTNARDLLDSAGLLSNSNKQD